MAAQLLRIGRRTRAASNLNATKTSTEQRCVLSCRFSLLAARAALPQRARRRPAMDIFEGAELSLLVRKGCLGYAG